MSNLMTEREAREMYADWFTRNAYGLRYRTKWAEHVDDQRKDDRLHNDLILAEQIANGTDRPNFTTWQRLQYYMTGVSVPFMSK